MLAVTVTAFLVGDDGNNTADPFSAEQALRYKAELQKINPDVHYLMTLYLSEDLTPAEIRKAKQAGIVGASYLLNPAHRALTPATGVKSYPRGVTTNSDGGIESWTRKSPFVVGFENEKQSQGFLGEVAGAVRHGQDVPFEPLENPRELAPMLSENVKVAYRLEGQRYFEPGPFMEALGQAFIQRGGTLRTGVEVTDVNSTRAPSVTLSTGEHLTADTVVIATGAWLPRLAAPLGVKVKVQAGRGYSFSVATDQPAEHPVYLPHARMACTPYQRRFRIAGTMEFKHADEPFDPGRITAIVNEARKLMTGVDLDARQDEWVGSRPVTPDGLPLIGASQVPNVYVAGGHGMWGMVLGPITGRLLADQITTGTIHPAITPFDPLR